MDIYGFLIDIATNHNLRWLLFAYLIGSIPFGFLLAKIFAHVDVRKLGSCSVGATNVLRVVKQHSSKAHLAKPLAAATMLCDLLKGTLVTAIGLLFSADIATIWGMAIMVIFGHCYSIFLGFRGGKGVATTAGALLCLVPLSAILGLLCWVIIGKLFKISSIASLFGIAIGLLSTFAIYPNNEINSHVPHMLILVFIFFEHLPNIIRLFKKQECKVI